MTVHILVALDGSEADQRILTFVGRHLCLGDFRLHLVTVVPPIAYTALIPAGGSGISPGALGTMPLAAHAERQLRGEEKHASNVLQKALQSCTDIGIHVDVISSHSLPADGGASGVAESLVKFANEKLEKAVAVIGNRGMGSWKQSIMSMAGLGSVGSYCVHNMKCPVIVVKPAAGEIVEPAPIRTETEPATTDVKEVPAETLDGSLKICACVDDSEEANDALGWAVERLVNEKSQLHIVSVAKSVGSPQFADPTGIEVVVLSGSRCHEDAKAALELAESICAKGVKTARNLGVKDEQIFWRVLRPEGGASDVSAAVSHYIKDNEVDVCVLGRHGFGSWKRGLLALVGLGSVSDDCVPNLPCTVAVYKSRTD